MASRDLQPNIVRCRDRFVLTPGAYTRTDGVVRTHGSSHRHGRAFLMTTIAPTLRSSSRADSVSSFAVQSYCRCLLTQTISAGCFTPYSGPRRAMWHSNQRTSPLAGSPRTLVDIDYTVSCNVHAVVGRCAGMLPGFLFSVCIFTTTLTLRSEVIICHFWLL